MVHQLKNQAPNHAQIIRLDEAIRRELKDPKLANTDVTQLVASLSGLILHYIIEASGERVTLDLDVVSKDQRTNKEYFMRVSITEKVSGDGVM